MKLKSVHVRMFRNILDSGEVEIQADVTCFVGKNESGKTAFLNALFRLNPARTNPAFSVQKDYPAWLEKRNRRAGQDLDTFTPVVAVFEWQANDVKAIEDKFGPGVAVAGGLLTLQKTYQNKFIWQNGLTEAQAVKNFLASQSLPQKEYNPLQTFASLAAKLTQDTAAAAENTELLTVLSNAHSALKVLLGPDSDFSAVAWSIAEKRLPKFLYFSDYSRLPYTVSIRKVLTDAKLTEPEATAKALLVQGGAEQDYMLNPDYEMRKRELENVANALSDDVKSYWSQNAELRVEPDITKRTESSGNGQQAVIDELKLRIRDNRHSLSLPFDEHSAGFQWFFSFLAAFSEFEYKDPAVVILLDEPAVGLHAKAQADFLRFIDERLAVRCQVLYTTHSPFMVQPGKLERVRLVEDRGTTEGSVVTKDVLTRDRDTLFPLQGALGYDLVQHLFVAENNIVVEGTSDYAYIKTISDFLQAKGRTCLDAKWSIVPVGGADAIPTFVALLGHHLRVTVLVDSRRDGHQRLMRMAADGYLNKQRIVVVGEFLAQRAGDIEDLFEVDEYLALYNKAFGKSVTAIDLAGSDPIVARIARFEGVERFDHGRPAEVLLRERDARLSTLSESTLNRFETLFDRLNKTA